MNREHVFRGLVAVGLMAGTFAGCEKEDAPKPSVPTPPAPNVTPKAAAGNADAGTTSGALTTPLRTTTPATSPSALASTGPTTARATAGADRAAGAAPAPAPVAGGGDQAKQAQDLIAQAITAIKDKRLADARTSLDKVDAMKDALPRATYEQLVTVRGTLNSAEKLQGGNDATLPDDADNK